MIQKQTDNDLLVKFERHQISEPYKSYYLTKRYNFFSTIQRFPQIWNCFMQLDAILQREFDTMQRLRDPHLMLPMILFMNAHQKMRVAAELGCSTCLSESHSLLRDAIESAVHGHRLASDPQLLKLWIEKNDSEGAKKIFSKEFEQKKAIRLFDGLPELHRLWKQFSEFGSHTNINSIVTRFVITRTATDLQYNFHYLGGEPKILIPALFEIILVFNEIETVLFKLGRARLELDSELVDMRTRFDKEKEATRQVVIKTANLPPPAVL